MFELLNGELAENGLDEALIHSIDDFITMNRYRLMRSGTYSKKSESSL